MLLSETFDLNGAFVGMCYNPDFVSSILVPSFACKPLGVRSLANASRARQFNPLNPPGVGWVKFF